MTRWCLLAAALVSASACTKHEASNPLTEFGLPNSFELRGQVLERVAAGSYLYLRITDGHTEHWVATLRRTATSDASVNVTVFAQAPHFHSSRLDREFSPLLFGAVSPAPESP